MVGATNTAGRQVFIRDRQTSQTCAGSVATDGTPSSGGQSLDPDMAAGGGRWPSGRMPPTW